MKIAKQQQNLSQKELSSLSKVYNFFVDTKSSERKPFSEKDGITNRDILGHCDSLLAKGHSKRLYETIADIIVE